MLENILHKYFGLSESWNNIYEKEEENWNNAYNKLINLLYDLKELGVLDNANSVIDELDKIDSESEE